MFGLLECSRLRCTSVFAILVGVIRRTYEPLWARTKKRLPRLADYLLVAVMKSEVR